MIRRAWSILTVTKSSESKDGRTLEGIASTPKTDRAGDIVESDGAEFTLPIPLLAHHNSRQPIGHVTAVEVTKDGINIVASIVKNSGLDYVEEAWLQIKAGLVRGLSIGFLPKEFSILKEGGLRFTKWSWLELSAVTIPANQDASIARIKALDLAAAALPGRPTTKKPGLSAALPPAKKGPAMTVLTISDRIKAAQSRLVSLKDELTAAITKQDDQNPDEILAAEIDQLTDMIDKGEAHLAQLKAAEGRLALAAGRGDPDDVRTPAIVMRSRVETQPLKAVDILFKQGVVALLSKIESRQPAEIMAERYKGVDEVHEMHRFLITKAAQGPATTTSATWAAALVQQAIGQFLDLLTPIALYPKFAALGARLDFGTAGQIKLPYREDTPNAPGDLRAAFVGEGDPIPVRRASVKSVLLTPKKAGVISTFTRELARQSTPAIETLIRSFILRDTAIGIDTALLDALPGTTVRPPGIMNGVTPTAGSVNASKLDAILEDLATLIGKFSITQEGRSLAWVMNPAQALALGFIRIPTGQFMFPDINQAGGTLLGLPALVSSQVTNHAVSLVDLSAFFTATGDTPEWNVSDVATVHEDDGSYAADGTVTQPAATVKPIATAGSPNVVAAPVRSLWQTASYGIRMILDMDWGFVRSASVQTVTTVW